MGESKEKLPPLEEGLLKALKAIDNQIARAMQRTPKEREEHGVQKWEPMQDRVERLCSLILNWFGDEEVGLDSSLVMAQVFPKVLGLLVDELGEEGLGKLRTEYLRDALEKIIADSERAQRAISGESVVN